MFIEDFDGVEVWSAGRCDNVMVPRVKRPTGVKVTGRVRNALDGICGSIFGTNSSWPSPEPLDHGVFQRLSVGRIERRVVCHDIKGV